MEKKSADTTKATPGSVINTMLNPFAGRIGERYTPEWFRPSGGEKPSSRDTLLFHLAALAGTYGTLTAFVRLAAARAQREEGERKFKKKIKAYLGAEMPVFSPDPSLRDPVEERRLAEMGIPELATEGIPRQLKMTKTSEDGKTEESIVGGFADPFSEKWSMVLPVLAVAGSSALAYKIVNDMMEKGRQRRLTKDIARARNELDRLNYEQLLRSRGLAGAPLEKISEEEAGGLLTAPFRAVKRQAQEWAGTRPADPSAHTWTGGAAALAILVAATSLGIGAIASKAYFDDRDVNRRRLKAMTEAMRGLSLAERPPVLVPLIDPALSRKLNAQAMPAPKPVRKLTVEAPPVPIEAVPVDPYDVSMKQAVSA